MHEFKFLNTLRGHVGKMWSTESCTINFKTSNNMTIRFIIKTRRGKAVRRCHHREVASKRTPVYVRIRDGRNFMNASLAELRNYLMHNYLNDKSKGRLSKDWLVFHLGRYYNRGKDSEGSRAFSRYRSIDTSMKKELVLTHLNITHLS